MQVYRDPVIKSWKYIIIKPKIYPNNFWNAVFQNIFSLKRITAVYEKALKSNKKISTKSLCESTIKNKSLASVFVPRLQKNPHITTFLNSHYFAKLKRITLLSTSWLFTGLLSHEFDYYFTIQTDLFANCERILNF